MLYINVVISIVEVVIVTIPILLTVAFVTVAERKTMASMQRRLGPNIVGYYGLLQAFADALKLLLKEYVSPTQANVILFFLGPIITLIFSLLGYAVIPFAPGLTLFDFNLGILFMLAVSSLATYGILLAGWSANSKYAFLGSLRSTAQLISYELVLTSLIFIIILFTASFNLTVNIEMQRSVWFALPLFPLFIAFFIGAIAETNRAPFDLAEAESELVSGFMTEHSAVVFVFFFLAEYASIILICILTSVLFLGGYGLDINIFLYLIEFASQFMLYLLELLTGYNGVSEIDTNLSPYAFHILGEIRLEKVFSSFIMQSILYSTFIGVKSFFIVFVFIWVRASFPRIRYDQLMVYCWTVLLPVIFAFIILIPCILYVFDIIPNNILFS